MGIYIYKGLLIGMLTAGLLKLRKIFNPFLISNIEGVGK
jgi:hypothetical protein